MNAPSVGRIVPPPNQLHDGVSSSVFRVNMRGKRTQRPAKAPHGLKRRRVVHLDVSRTNGTRRAKVDGRWRRNILVNIFTVPCRLYKGPSGNPDEQKYRLSA